MITNSSMRKDWCCLLLKMLVVIALLFIVCYVVCYSVNQAVTKGLTDQMEGICTVTSSPLDSLVQVRIEEAICQLREENREPIGNFSKALNGNINLWMSRICAVCTLLPIASNLYYSYQMNEIRRELDDCIQKKTDEWNESVKEKMSEYSDEVKEQKEQLNSESAMQRMLQMSSTLTLLCDLQQLFQKNNMFLTGEEDLKQLLSAFEKNLSLIQNVKDPIGDKETQQYKVLYYLLLCKIELLLNTYETLFGYPQLMTLLSIKEQVYKAKEPFGTGSVCVSDLNAQVVSISYQVVGLFQKEMEKRL